VAEYPAEIPDFTLENDLPKNVTNESAPGAGDGDRLMAEWWNRLLSLTEAMARTLGVNPQGSAVSVASRLQAMENASRRSAYSVVEVNGVWLIGGVVGAPYEERGPADTITWKLTSSPAVLPPQNFVSGWREFENVEAIGTLARKKLLSVVGNPASLTALDTAAHQLVTDMGLDVPYVDDGAAPPASLSAYAGVTLEQSAGGSTHANYRTIPLRLLLKGRTGLEDDGAGVEASNTKNLAITSGDPFGDGYGDDKASVGRPKQTQLRVTADGSEHPLLAGLSEVVTFASNPVTLNAPLKSRFPAGTLFLAEPVDDATRVCIYLLPGGQALADGTVLPAGAFRLGVGFADMPNLNATGKRILQIATSLTVGNPEPLP
jgi:hypothetical protein